MKRRLEGRERARARRVAWAVAAGLVAASCKGTDGPQTGSETHFLERCSESCPDGLSCLCGVCTRVCTTEDECSSLAGEATCVPVAGQPGADGEVGCKRGASCDLSCVKADDCAALGAGYRCDEGFCRAGTQVCPTQALAAGEVARQVLVGDTVRSYTLHVPANYQGDTPVPLVLDFHPMSLGVDWEKSQSGYQALSEQQGFLVAWPQGLETSWNIGPCCTSSTTIDDYAFARALVRQVSSEACVDPRRVHAVGFSMGGGMAYYLACKESEVFASVAVSSMDLFDPSEIDCEPSRPVAEISFRGDADTVVPYTGGTSYPPGYPQYASKLLGAVGTFERWAEIDECASAPSTADANGCSTYSKCGSGVEVTLCTTAGGGEVVGDAATAWEMLSRQPMP